MNPEFDHAKTIFLRAIEGQPPANWEVYLDGACGDDAPLRSRVAQLLKAHLELGSFRDDAPAIPRTLDMPAEPLISVVPGTVIGPYKLLQQIGEGGMGIVYMAEQVAPVRRKVALKIIKPGMDTREVIARFEAERQALALMDHPNIARVFDAGATDTGHPYFVMELVRGVPITDYCDENNLAVYQRLELFVTVCHAVQHAHQKGIIHRDIKPSNVLVTLHDGRPVPKVIDFGLAKAIGHQLTDKTLFTRFAQMVGTPLYMSPEQAELTGLDIDTRGDIYSLGVLLYELLTGTTPFEGSRMKKAALDEIRRMIREEDPPSPSMRLSSSAGATQTAVAAHRRVDPRGLSRLVRGDLDWIVMKALEKDRARRYETANGFAADIGRYLTDEPVEACPPSSAYRLRKFARRNRGSLATATLVLTALIVGTFISTLQAIRATRAEGLAEERLIIANTNYETAEAQRQRAQTSEQDAKTKAGIAQDARAEAVESLRDAMAAVDQMLTQVGHDRLAGVPQMEPVRRELLHDALKFYQRFLEKNNDNPGIRRETARAYLRLARIQRSLGQYAEAVTGYEKVFVLFAELESRSPLEPDVRLDLCAAHIEISTCFRDLGNLADQEKHTRNVVEIAENLLKEFPDVPIYADRLADANGYLADLLASTRPEAAEKILRNCLTLAIAPENRAAHYRSLGLLLKNQGRTEEAEQVIRQGVAHCEQSAAERSFLIWAPEKLGIALFDLSGLVAAQGRLEEAEPLSGRAIEILDKVATDYPAGPYFRNCQAWAWQDRAGILRRLNRTTDAEQAYRRSLDLFAKLAADFPTIHGFPQTAFAMRLNLGQFLEEAKRPEDALGVYSQAIDFQGKRAGDLSTNLNHWHGFVRTQIELSRVLATSGKTAEAESGYRRAVEILEKLEEDYGGKPGERRDLAQIHFQGSRLLADVGRKLEAEKLCGYAIKHFTELSTEFPTVPEYRVTLAYAHNDLGWLIRGTDNGRISQAEKEHRLSLALFEKLATDFPTVIHFQNERAELLQTVASVLRDQGNLAGAKPFLEQAMPLAQSVVESEPQNRIYRERYHRVRRDLARLLVRLGESAVAEISLRQVLVDCENQLAESPSDPDSMRDLAKIHIALAVLFKANGRLPELERSYHSAIGVYQKLSCELPSDREARHQLGRCHNWLGLLLADSGRHQEAEQAYRQALDIFGILTQEVNPTAGRWHRHELASTHMDLGSLLRKCRRMADAEKAFRDAIAVVEKLNADFPTSYYPEWMVTSYTGLALALSTAGQIEEADQVYRKLLELKPESAQTMNYLAWLLATCEEPRFRNATRAVELASKAVSLAPKDGNFWNTLGAAYYRAGNWETSIEALNKSMELRNGGDPSDWFFLALAEWQRGNKADARRWHERAVEWIDKHQTIPDKDQPPNGELKRFRTEVEDTLK